MVIELENIEGFEEINLTEIYDLTIEDNSNYYLKTNSNKLLVHNSGKTWAGIDFLLASSAREYITDAKFIITRETAASFKTTLADDFNRKMPQYQLTSPFAETQNVKQFNLFRNTVHLMGADNPNKFEGAGSDIFWMNETLDQQNEVFDQLEQRCRRFFWFDYNPKVSDHWVYNKVCNRDDVQFLKTTFEDNPFISDAERNKILSYEPTHPEDRHLDIDKRRPHPTNIKNGTADDYRWNVYGLGLRMAPEGLIFRNINWIDEFPEDLDRIWYGLDFGFTNSPTALVMIGKKKRNVYAKLMFYESTESTEDIVRNLKALKIKKGDIIYADAAEPGIISDLRNDYGYTCVAAKKFPGSIKYGIDLLKRYKINIVRNPNAKKEAENYCYRVINGIKTNEPIDDFNHFWDAFRYGTQHELRNV